MPMQPSISTGSNGAIEMLPVGEGDMYIKRVSLVACMCMSRLARLLCCYPAFLRSAALCGGGEEKEARAHWTGDVVTSRISQRSDQVLRQASSCRASFCESDLAPLRQVCKTAHFEEKCSSFDRHTHSTVFLKESEPSHQRCAAVRSESERVLIKTPALSARPR